MSGGTGTRSARVRLGVAAALCVAGFALVELGAWALLGLDPAAVAGPDASRGAAVAGVGAGILACALFLGAFAGSVPPGRYRPGIATGVVVAVGTALFQVVVAATFVGAGGGTGELFGVLPALGDALVAPLSGVALVAALGAERCYSLAARRGRDDR
ncbi:hypothetical protein [Cellulomonas sp. PhB143]|uniref:hypothetical protein n=1 Tax=Cellulomonas sp. PhB143 TaxID=2485186 RepID=UPI000F469C2D|nr:hypothetical protein [Cellulomonas sp. PhB143]ROS76732.1 hypothetical protein EDF32_1553 [Cellulomonas sp. PhB143]